MQLYDRTKNETDIKLKLGNNADASNISEVMSGQADVIVPIQSGILLSFADYFYEGRTPSRKGSVKFTFLSEHKSTFKSPPDFSIIADGIEAQKGAAELPGLWSYKENSANVEQQMITLDVPFEVFLTIAGAKKVEFKLESKSYRLANFQQKYMRAFAKMIEQLGK